LQFRFLAAVLIFLGSYLPLALILLAQDFNYNLVGQSICWRFWEPTSTCVLPLNHPGFSLTIFVVCLISFCLSLAALASARPKLPIDVTQARYIPAELMTYTLPYVVSFMSIGYQETGKFVGLTIFLAWMFWITHKSGQLILNPILIAFGWRLYEITYAFPGDASAKKTGRALVKGAIEAGQRYPHTVVQDVIILCTKKPTGEGDP
jgi:hypothetical protein